MGNLGLNCSFLNQISSLPVFFINFLSQVVIFKFLVYNYQDLWAISANANNYFGLFATHFFSKTLGFSMR